MAVDLTKLSDGDLQALRSGNLSGVSDAGLQMLRSGGQPAQPAPQQFVPSGEKPSPSWTDPEIVAGNPVTRFALGAASPVLGAAQFAANQFGVGDGINAHLSRLEQMKQAGREQLGSTGFDWTEAAGSVLSPVWMKAAQLLGRPLPFMRQVGVGAGLGAAGGATAPVVNDTENFWRQKAGQVAGGAVVGAAIPGAVEGVRRTGNALYHGVIEPWANPAAIKGRTYLEAAGDKADDIINLLQQNRQIVPGSAPTAGEAAAPAGRAEFAALQRSAANVRPSEYVARGEEQNAARLAAVRTVGQDRAALEAAEAARNTNARAAYGAVANDVVVPADRVINSLLSRPSMDKAISRAQQLTAEQGGQWGAGGGLTVQNMQNVKMALDDMVKAPEQFGIGASEAKAINDTRTLFVRWLGQQSPKWEAARSQYASDSAPINQMQVGQYLEKKLVPALSEESRQTATQFSNAVREAPTTIKRATGNPRFDELTQVLTPQQMQAIQSVQDDLARSARQQTLAQRGSQAGPNAVEAATQSMEGPTGGKLPNLLNRGAMLTNAIISRLEGKINRKLAAEIAVEMLNPPAVAESMQQATMRAARNKSAVEAIDRLLIKASGGAGQVYGAERQEKR